MKDYFEQFDDESIEKALLHTQTIPILEEIIAKDMLLYSKLDGLPLNYGKIPQRSDLPLLLEEVKPVVDDFLGASRINFPTVDYKSIFEGGLQFSDFGDFLLFLPSIYHVLTSKGHYDPISDHISLKKEPRSSLIPVLAHEYSHQVQERKFLFLKSLQEGQARSVQRYVSYLYAEKEDNPAFSLCNLMNYDLPELKVAYVWLCEGLNLTPKSYLCRARTKREKKYLHRAKRFKKRNTKPNYHIQGNAFFSVLEFLEGTFVHREIMANRYRLRTSFFSTESI